MITRLDNLFGHGLVVSVGVILAIGLTVSLGVFTFFNTAAPTTLTITSGPEGSSFNRIAERYKKILAREGVKLNILPSEGSTQNLARLLDPKTAVDVGFVLGGEVAKTNVDRLMSLGSINYQPLMIFYQGEARQLLSEFKGARLDIGAEGSGTRLLALALLKANGLEPKGEASFVEVDAKDLLTALQEKTVDAVFVMSDSTPTDVLRKLLRTPDVHLFDFSQADAYTRRISYLNKLVLPKGSLDLGKNIPPEDVHLIGPTVELVARDDLHPALSDLLLEAAREVHSGPGLYRKRGEFPAPQEHEFRISPDATRYYTTGKTFLYRTFPFWVASLIARTLAVLVPIVLLLIPGLRVAPVIYRWRIESRIHRWYKVLLDLEREAQKSTSPNRRTELLKKLDHIEANVNRIVVPAAFGDLFYGLRGHVKFVRNTLMGETEPTETDADSADAPSTPA
ncbi:MAG: C4-dicarboxylate ABC transporter substrate-binding protein [Betaproteobacteria bacterium]|nr:C4-dicarboxylate ABC transporter substrate-binding protein [Betaproteobacteria bacterium]